MADFRRFIFALALLAFLTGIATTVHAQGLACDQLQGVIQDVRKEGITEYLGDIVLSCTAVSGTTPNGGTVPPATVRVQVPGTNITSRVVATSSTGQNGPFVEALLSVDEPEAINSTVPQRVCGTSGDTESPAGTGVCPIISDGNPADTYNGTAGHPNIFQGHSVQRSNVVEFPGVPFDPPGTGLRRTIRITNIRIDVANAGGLSDGSFITATIDVQGAASISVLTQTVTIGRVRSTCPVGSTPNASNICTTVTFDSGYLQCVPEPNNRHSQSQKIVITEGFQSAFKPKNIAQQLTQVYGAPDQNQAIPGSRFFTESGFSKENASGLGAAWTSNHGANASGLADGGTRIYVSFSAPPAGATVAIPACVPLMVGSTQTGLLVMISGWNNTGRGWNHAGPVSPLTASSLPTTTQTVANCSPDVGPFTGSTGTTLTQGATTAVVYEVLYSDPNNIETATIHPSVTYGSSSLTDASTGVATVVTKVSYAPWYTYTQTPPAINSGPDSDGIPRFTPRPDINANLIQIGKCACSLLFPWIVSDNSYVTGLVVSNTSMDPTNAPVAGLGSTGYTAIQQSGKVTVYYFGQTGPTPSVSGTASQTASAPSSSVPAGLFTTFIAPSGFAGYAIANAQFQYCHGLAFLFNTSGAAPPLSYLGLVMDGTGINNGISFPLGRTNQLFQDRLNN